MQVKLMYPSENHERDMESRWTNERKANGATSRVGTWQWWLYGASDMSTTDRTRLTCVPQKCSIPFHIELGLVADSTFH